MKKTGLLLCLIMRITLSWAQAHYEQQIKIADSLYKAKYYKDAAIAYEATFKISKETVDINNRYNAACAWTLAGYTDNSFKNLDLIVGKTYFDYDHIVKDTDFNTIHGDKRWLPLLQKNKGCETKPYCQRRVISGF